MEKNDVETALREMMREQLCCLGRIASRHRVPDDVVWDIVKGFDVIYQRARRRSEAAPQSHGCMQVPPRAAPHPGLAYLLNRLDHEGAP